MNKLVPWYNIADKSDKNELIKFWVIILVLGILMGSCFKPEPLQILLGSVCAAALLHIVYSQGTTDGAAAMFSYIELRSKEAANALRVMNNILRDKNE